MTSTSETEKERLNRKLTDEVETARRVEAAADARLNELEDVRNRFERLNNDRIVQADRAGTSKEQLIAKTQECH